MVIVQEKQQLFFRSGFKDVKGCKIEGRLKKQGIPMDRGFRKKTLQGVVLSSISDLNCECFRMNELRDQ